jgi:hypothetical protein
MTSGKLCLKPTLASIDDFSLKIGFFLKIRMNNPRDDRSFRSDFVGSSDRNDYYRFSVSQAINFNLTRSSDTFGGPRHSCGGGKTNLRL